METYFGEVPLPGTGARLTLKGKTGADQAFTLTATEDAAAPGLAQFNVGVGEPATIGTGDCRTISLIF